MTEYKVGDRVRVVSHQDGSYGKLGTVASMDENFILPVRVDLDGGRHLGFHPNELEHAGPAPDPAQYPADGHPGHYTAGLPVGVAAVDVIKAHLKAGGTWDTANALKYILRHPLKGNATQDIKKAIRCLNMWIAEQETAA